MALIIPDLRQDVTINGVSLNNATSSNTSGRVIWTGSRVDYMDVQPAEVVQFTEKMALTDGLDYGAAYKGARVIEIRGVSEAATRGAAFDLVSAIEAACSIASGTFGLVTLTFASVSGSGGTSGSHSVSVRPNGLHVPVTRDETGGANGLPVSIPWSFTAVAFNPAIS